MPGYPYRGRVLLRSAKLCPLGYYQGATIRVAVIDRRVNNHGDTTTGRDRKKADRSMRFSPGSAVVSSAEGYAGRERLPAAQAGAVEAFVRRYYAGVSAEDLCEREVPDLLAPHSRTSACCGSDGPPSSNCGSTTRASRSTAGSPPTRSSRWSPTTCASWWTLWSWSLSLIHI